MRTVVILQARMESTRLPGKVLLPVIGIPMIELLLKRLSLARHVDQIILATSLEARNSPLVEHVEGLGYAVYRGSEQDVLDRYYQAACIYKADVIVRITGDCPLVDPEIVDTVITAFKESKVDYASNIYPPTYPDGLDVEVFTFSALVQAWQAASRVHEREHVTPYIRETGRFQLKNITSEEDYSCERWTVDEPDDFDVIRKIFEYFHPRRDFGWREILKLRQEHPEWFVINQHLVRNMGEKMNTGQKLWKRAKRIIPGGSMLLSKRAEMFLPGQWPAYYSKAKGCRVQDLDRREYIDMSLMGIGTCILGYCQPEVDEAVHNAVKAGSMSTLNCPEEVYLAERLIELHPWADMVRFARSGGEANAIAIRIARAASGREKVAFCGYHGWHDWYLAANLTAEDKLGGHLLPGLEPNGVPSALRNTVFPFNYNRLDELEALVREHDIGVIKMEVMRNQKPEEGFLENVRELATKLGIVLIFDECTSGFRETLGGLHKRFGVEPDMAVLGKAMGNGYAITAVIGRREIMNAAQTTFISSTFWTERIGPVAALKTLEVMERIRSYEIITAAGCAINDGWNKMAEKHGLNIQITGLPALTSFSFPGDNMLAYRTLITQEMLSRGYLATNTVYVCTEHTGDVISTYLENLDPIFKLIADCENGRNIFDLLKGPICHAGFSRLN